MAHGRGWFFEKLFRRLVVLIPMFAVSPVLVADLPMLIRIPLAALEAIELLILRDMEVEFYNDRSIIRQLTLKFVDFPVGPLPFCLRAELLHAFDQHPAIPGPVENRGLTVGRKLIPKPPHIVVLKFLRRRFDDRIDANETGIEPLGQPFDRSAFTGRVRALKNDDQRSFAFA